MPVSALVAGFIAVLVGFTSSAAIIFQAAASANASPEMIGSWIMALSFGMGLSSIGLSLYYRMPILTAWSTPGAALLSTSLAGYSMPEAMGAFLFSAFLITLLGLSGLFEKLMSRIPLPIAGAMLAGVLLRFGLDVFRSMETKFLLVAGMFFVFLFSKRIAPRYAALLTLLFGVGIAGFDGSLNFSEFHFAIGTPIFTMPEFTPRALIGIGLPLFIVTMASQNIPGIAVLRGAGFSPPISPLITWTGITNIFTALFGGFALNLAAITAAICMGREAHEDKNKRYLAAIAAGCFYLVVGIFGATVTALFQAFPKELVLSIAGLALLGTIANSLETALLETELREPALITFLVSASGISLLGIGAAFWGLLAGLLAWMISSSYEMLSDK